MIEPPRPIHRQHLLHQEQRRPGVQRERAVEVVGGDFGQRHCLAQTGVGHHHVHLVRGAPDGVGNAVEVLQPGRVRLDGGDVAADVLHRRVKRALAPAEDEHLRALFDKASGDGEPDATASATDDGDLAF